MDSTTGASASPAPTASSAPAPNARRARNPLINRNYTLLWGGQMVSIVGDLMFTTTLVIWIATQLAAHQVWSPIAVSGVLFASAIPSLLVGPFAGVFVDRANKRHLMLWMDGLRTVIVGSLALASGAVALPFIPGGRLPALWTLGLVYTVVLLVNVGEQFFRPSMMATIRDVVPPDQQAQAIGLGEASVSLALILGPSLAAPLYAAFGPQWALLIDAASFAVSYLTIRAIHPTGAAAAGAAAGEGTGFRREFWAGVRYYFSNRVLVTMLVGVVIAVMGASAINTLDIFFARQNLLASTSQYGLLGGVFGVGAVIGAVLAGVLAQRFGLARTLWLTVLLFGVLFSVLSRQTDYYVALALFGVAGVLQSALNIAAGPIMLRESPPDMIGRVMSIFQPAMNLSILVSTAVIGYLAGVTLAGFHARALGMSFGPVDTIWLAGGVIMGLSGVVMAFGLRGTDRRYREADRHAAQESQASQAEAVATARVSGAIETALAPTE